MVIKINKIVKESFVDGPGARTVVFLQGCSIHCPGCQNKKLQDPQYGFYYDVLELSERLAFLSVSHGNVTISGGEPFDQPKELAMLVIALRKNGVKNIVVYTGYQWANLISGISGKLLWNHEVLSRIDTLVDGPYIMSLDSDSLSFRGSYNQMFINVTESLKAPAASIILDDRMANIQVQISNEGSIILPAALSSDFDGIGELLESRMCGQTAESIRG